MSSHFEGSIEVPSLSKVIRVLCNALIISSTQMNYKTWTCDTKDEDSQRERGPSNDVLGGKNKDNWDVRETLRGKLTCEYLHTIKLAKHTSMCLCGVYQK